MAHHVVGCVPYINARPLVRMFAETGDVDITYDVPSKLPSLLDARRAEAVLASAYDALRTPDRTYAEGVCIGSSGPVESVKIFSKVPFEKIERLAEDPSSLTSNALAKGILAEVYGVKINHYPLFVEGESSQMGIFADETDAAVLIGDRGMKQAEEGLHVLDLGEAWTKLTGLPFVWALWIGSKRRMMRLTPELVGKLNVAARWGETQIDTIAKEASEATGIPRDRCHNYLSNVMDYQLTDRHLQGLKAYQDLLLKHRLLSERLFPTAVQAATDVATAT